MRIYILVLGQHIQCFQGTRAIGIYGLSQHLVLHPIFGRTLCTGGQSDHLGSVTLSLLTYSSKAWSGPSHHSHHQTSATSGRGNKHIQKSWIHVVKSSKISRSTGSIGRSIREKWCGVGCQADFLLDKKEAEICSQTVTQIIKQ